MSGRLSMLMSSKADRAFYLLAITILLAGGLFGQEGLSTLRGTVNDKSGAVVPGASISAREVLTNVVARTVTSDAQGNYEIPGLKAFNVLSQDRAERPGIE